MQENKDPHSARKPFAVLANIDGKSPVSPTQFIILGELDWSEQFIKETKLFDDDKKKSLLEEEIQHIPLRALLLKASHFVKKYGKDIAFDAFHKECLYYVETKTKAQLMASIEYIKAGNLVFAPFFLDQVIFQLSLELPFRWLPKEEVTPYLLPLIDKKNKLSELISHIEQCIQVVCEKAVPGVIIEDFVHQELSSIKPLLKALPEVRAVTLVNFLDRDDIVRLIHEKIIRTRANYCAHFMLSDDDNLKKLRAEFRKITVYRVRRNVIETLFDDFKGTIKNRTISESEEKIFLFLQEEYLRALMNEIDRIDYAKIRGFLLSFKEHRIFKPLPAKSFWKNRNSNAQQELALLIQNIEVPQIRTIAENAPLHNIDCPIEIDVLGEIARELVDLTIYNEDSPHEVMNALKLMQNTYRKIQSIFFEPEPSLLDLAKDEANYSLLKERILHWPEYAIRREIIRRLYEDAKDVMETSPTLLQRLREFLLYFYLDTLEKELEDGVIENEKEKILCYEALVEPAFKTALLQEIPSDVSTRFYEKMLKKILSK